MICLNNAQASDLSERLAELFESELPYIDRMLRLRKLTEQLYKYLTSDSRLSFNGLFARMQYANNEANISSQLATRANQLRILCNQIVHDEISTVDKSTFETSASVVASLISNFCEGYANPFLSQLLTSESIKDYQPKKHSEKQSFICVLDSWSIKPNSAGQEALEIIATKDDGYSCTVILNNSDTEHGIDGRKYTILAKSLWKYASIHFHHLTPVSGREGVYQSNPKTLVVLEPDFLVDASAIAECFDESSSNPAYFILNRLFSNPAAEPMIQGMVVNSILDELILNPGQDYLQMFKSGIAAMPIAFVSLGKDVASRIYNRVRDEHLPQLMDFANNLNDESILLEPSYLCPEYGLQGRLDLLSQSDGKYNIIELKSGKPHPIDVWPTHRMQTIAYNMIIRSVYGSQRVNKSAILYSSAKDKPERYVSNTTQSEQDLMMCRNRILGIMHLLSEQPESFFSWILQSTDIPANEFMQAKFRHIKALLSQLEDYEREWFYEQIKRIIREIWFSKTGDNGLRSESSYGHNALWQQSSSEKLAANKIVPDLHPQSYNKKQIIFSLPEADIIADFRDGDIVVLYSMNEGIERQEILRGAISRLDEQSLQINIRGGIRNSQRLSKDSKWAMEHDTMETALYSPLSSLTAFISSPKNIRQLYLGLRMPASDGVSIDSDNFDIKQVIAKMHATQELFIIQGPPGTGKTSGLLGRYVQEVYKQSDKRLLIVSFTNRAVDEICLCLSRASIPFLRIGNSNTITDNLLSQRIDGKRFDEIDEIVRNNRIWIATTNSANAWYQDMMRIIKIDELIIDEASQIIENSILGLVTRSPKTIMIGDQNQLPPISVQNNIPYSFNSPELHSLNYGSYHQSLMERLFKLHNTNCFAQSTVMLTQHYRMHNAIADLIGDYYQNKLNAATPEQHKALDVMPGQPPYLNNRLIWIDCPPAKSAHYDPLQVELISTITASLISSHSQIHPARDIGIVAPFRAMIHALRDSINKLDKAIVIDTVERFQGSERSNIILSLPIRSENDLRLLESISDDELIDRKLNVAVSRAKQRIIIVANIMLCQKSAHYNKIIDKISSSGLILSYTDLMHQL